MTKVKANIVCDRDGTYSIYVDEKAPINYGLVGEGATVDEAIADWHATYQSMKESYAERGRPFVEAQFTFAYDVPSFLAYYGGLKTTAKFIR